MVTLIPYYLRECREILIIFAIGLLTGICAWAATLPPGYCGGHVTATCPFSNPALNQQFQGDAIYQVTGR